MTFEALDHETPTADLDALRNLAGPASCRADSEALEVGSWAGRTALLLADYFRTVYCVDHFRGNPGDRLGDLARAYGRDFVFDTFCKNMGDRLFADVIPCVGSSALWSHVWPASRKLDLVFIDGSHEYEDVRADILGWRPHVRPGGLLVLHDRGIFPGVDRALAELLPNHKCAGATLAYDVIG